MFSKTAQFSILFCRQTDGVVNGVSGPGMVNGLAHSHPFSDFETNGAVAASNGPRFPEMGNVGVRNGIYPTAGGMMMAGNNGMHQNGRTPLAMGMRAAGGGGMLNSAPGMVPSHPPPAGPQATLPPEHVQSMQAM